VSTTDPLFVVAYNYNAFVKWCRAKGHAPHGGAVVYVRGADTLKGLRSDVRFLFLYGWQERSDSRAIFNRYLIIGRRP
jgi:hypothetical protein